MSAAFERAALLLQQRKFGLAERELRGVLGEEPDHAPAHALLALCLNIRQAYDEATDAARQAIHLAPDLALAHYALGVIMNDRNRFEEAAACALEAIRLAPEDADYHGMLSRIRMNQERWADALAAADKGLECDAGNVECANLRARALIQLGRKDEAAIALQGALERAPESSSSHSSQGWLLLEQGRIDKAKEHFKEALRLNPNNEHARQGIIEALKSKTGVYWLLLRYFLWMSKLGGQARWAVIIGGMLGARALRALGRSNPEFQAWTTPILIAYTAFVIFTWIGDPLFNLLLRLHPLGRLALSPEERVQSNVVGLLLLAGGGGLLAALAGFPPGLLIGVICVGLVIPVTSIFRCQEGWPRRLMTVYTAVLLVVAIGGLALLGAGSDAGLVLLGAFLLGLFASQFVGIGLSTIRPHR